MSLRLIALEEGPIIPVDRAVVIVGRHPQCHARLDSIRVSRRHCCMTREGNELIVQDLGSTNGIRINGQRVDEGRVRVGDELSIAHIRFRLDDGQGEERTMAATLGAPAAAVGWQQPLRAEANGANGFGHAPQTPPKPVSTDDSPIAAAVREMLPAEMAGCKIEVIVHMKSDAEHAAQAVAHREPVPEPCPPDSPP